MPLPPVPEFPDNDPVESLRMLRNYVRLILDYFSPLRIGVGLFALAAIGSATVYYFANLDSPISWSAEFVPMAFAVVGIVFSVKKLREEHHFAVIVLLVIVGVLGTLVLHLSRTHADAAHAKEMGDLRNRMDSVRNQNGQLLTAILSKPTPPNSQTAELERRENIQKVLRGEYILSHDNISPGLLAGTEYPPADWMNKRLHELGEKWAVAPPAAPRPVNAPAPQPPPEGKVVFALANGDDNASAVTVREDRTKIGTDKPSFDCLAPFICYTEDQLSGRAVDLDFTGKKYRRLFFMVANTSTALISKSTVIINISAADMADLKGISLYRPNQGRDDKQHIAVEYNQNETADLVPYSRTNNAADFVVDLEVAENSIQDFVVLFRISAANLTAHVVPVTVHIVKH